MKASLLAVLFLVLPFDLVSQTALRIDSLYAPSLGKTKSFVILRPRHVERGQTFPILYLLHGHGGNHLNWTTLTNIRKYVDTLQLVVVMPDAENSWYVNSISYPKSRFEDYIVSDLKRAVAARYPVDTTRQAIAGLSMGGYGAVMLALRHPGQYQFAGSLSGALNVPGEIPLAQQSPWGKGITPSLRQVFGAKPGAQWQRYDPFVLYKQTPKESLPYLYFVTGIQDGFPTFLPNQRAFTDSLRAYGARYEYHEIPGGHNWQFWDREILPLLVRMREILKF